MRAIAERHALPRPGADDWLDGSDVVFGLGTVAVLKLVAPPFKKEHEAEVIALRTLSAHPEIPAPSLIARGEIEGWPYLVETRMPGTPLGGVWRTMLDEQRRTVLVEIGAMLRRLHRVTPGGLAEVGPGWPEFLATEMAACAERQRKWGLAAHLVDEIPSFLRSAAPLDGEALFLHADATPGNLLVRNVGGAWHLSGLVDFGDATVGRREYDLLVPALFLARGDAARMAALLVGGYGYAAADLDAVWRRRMTALSLIHRFNDMTRFLEPPYPPSLEAMDRLWT